MLNALGGVGAMLATILLGFVLARRGWFGGGSSELISRLVVSVALPAYMVANVMGGYDRERLISMLPGLPVPFAVMIASYLLALGLAALARVRPARRGTFASMFALSNTIFIGLPVNLAIFGESSLPYVLLYYIANTTTFWTFGVYGIASDGALRREGPKPSILSAEGLRRILSPPLVAFLLAVALVLLGVALPKPILGFFSTLGGMTTPLSMLFIGIVISKVEWRKARLERDTALVLLGRFAVSPLLLVLVARPLALPPMMKDVFLVQSAMPAMTQTSIVAGRYGADAEYAGLCTALTTVLGLLVIPLSAIAAGRVF